MSPVPLFAGAGVVLVLAATGLALCAGECRAGSRGDVVARTAPAVAAQPPVLRPVPQRDADRRRAALPAGSDPFAGQYLVGRDPAGDGFQSIGPGGDAGIARRDLESAFFRREEQVPRQ